MHFAHPGGVTLCKIVVDGDHVDSLACQCVEIAGEGCHKGFTFTCAHFCNTSLMEGNTAHKLDKVGAHAKDTGRCFTDCCKCFNKQTVKGLALFKACLKLCGLCGQFFVSQCLVGVGKTVNLHCNLFDFVKFSFVFVENGCHFSPYIPPMRTRVVRLYSF